MLYLAIKAALSGIIIAVVSEVAKRNPGFGAFIASLPLVSLLGMIWLWRDQPDAANMAAHAISLPFAAAVAWRGLPIHRVRKKVPFVDAAGTRVEPDAPNAWKFETFVFDALPMADSGIVLEVERDREFAAVKNATGPDSPETARALLRAAGRL